MRLNNAKIKERIKRETNQETEKMLLNSQLVEHFKDLPDPRMVNKCDHLLLDIVIIAICATIANADSWEDIAAFGESKQTWLAKWLALPNGIPSPDTFQRVFAQLDTQAFYERFLAGISCLERR